MINRGSEACTLEVGGTQCCAVDLGTTFLCTYVRMNAGCTRARALALYFLAVHQRNDVDVLRTIRKEKQLRHHHQLGARRTDGGVRAFKVVSIMIRNGTTTCNTNNHGDRAVVGVRTNRED